tara:strand:- start:2831 stop:4630 length:1800 start_codon:yes stop_codon:yes gene_type:complete
MLLTFLFVFSLPVDIQAEDISIEATINTNRIELGSSLQLTVTITGTRDTVPIKLPEIDGLESRYVGPSTRISIVNGKFSSSVAYIYTLIPLKTGKFQIPSLSTTLSGKTYKTSPIDIEVNGKGASPGIQQDKASTLSLSLKDKVFMVAEMPKLRLYLNERSSLTFKLYVGDVSLRDVQFPDFEQIGLTVDEFQEPKQYRETIGGKSYKVAEFKTFIYPTRTGKLKIGPASLKINILLRNTERRKRPGRFGRFFDDDFMGSFFGEVQKHPINVESNAIAINVVPLPEEGKPENFSGAVGRFDFKSSISPTEVKVGDPITLKMAIRGDGNMKSVTMPALEAGENFKVYDPQIKEEKGGVKTLEQVVIPKSERTKEIPAIEFSYFNVEEKKYKTITRGPFSLKVIKPDEQDQFKIIEFGGDKKVRPKEKLGRDIVFIKERPGKFRKINSPLYRSPGFTALVLSSFIIWLGFLLVYKRTHKLKTDVVYARRLRAPKEARKGLQQAMTFMEHKQTKEFYNIVFKTLQDYFGNKFHFSSGAITYETVENKLKSSHIPPEISQSIKSIFSECDMVRYASAEINEDKMKDVFEKTQKIIDSIERRFK